MDFGEARRLVKENVPLGVLLLRLAEEAKALSEAAENMQQSVEDEAPAPVWIQETREKLVEAYGDVTGYIDLIFTVADYAKVDSRRASEMIRWAEQIQEDQDDQSSWRNHLRDRFSKVE